MQHKQIQETDRSGCFVLNNDIKYNHLTGGSALAAQENFVLWLEASHFQKVILVKPVDLLCHEMVANAFNCFKFEILRGE
jgi:hypothetical protein